MAAARMPIGDVMIVNGQTLTIVGVAPAGFQGTTIGLRPEVFVPITMRWLMQPGRTLDSANRAQLLDLSVRADEAGRDDRSGADRDQRAISRADQRRRSAVESHR